MKLLTRAEAAARCRVSLTAFDAHVRPGLTPKKIGRRVLFLEAEVAEQALRAVATPAVSRPTIRRRRPGATYLARYRMNGRQREVSLRTTDEFEATVLAARLYDRLGNLHRSDGPGVYLVRAAGGIKIGKATKSINERVSAIGTSNAGGAHLVAVLSPDPNDETFFHAGMREFRIGGEWFRDEVAALEKLASLIESGRAA